MVSVTVALELEVARVGILDNWEFYRDSLVVRRMEMVEERAVLQAVVVGEVVYDSIYAVCVGAVNEPQFSPNPRSCST